MPLLHMLRDNLGEDQVEGWDIVPEGAIAPEGCFKFLHVCFPQTTDFLKWMRGYVEDYDPDYVIIHSTLSPGMTNYLDEKLGEWRDQDQIEHSVRFFYSPVRGNRRDNMRRCLESYTKYVSPHFDHKYTLVDSHRRSLARQRKEIERHLKHAGFKVKMLLGPAKELEWAKLLDLAWYGVNIAFYQELERIVVGENMDYAPIREFIESTPIESKGKAPRVVFYGGHIGGHCVIQGIEKILPWYDVPMLKAVIESNIKRESEVAFNPASVLGRSSA